MNLDVLADRVGWTVLHSIWQLTSIAVLAFALLKLVRLSHNGRYSVLCGTLALMTAVPVTTFWYQSQEIANDSRLNSSIGLGSTGQGGSSGSLGVMAGSKAADAQDQDAQDQIVQGQNRQVDFDVVTVSASQAGMFDSAEHERWNKTDASSGWTRIWLLGVVASYLAPIWGVGVLLCSTWNVAGYFWIRRRVGRANPASSQLTQVFEECLRRMRLSGRVMIRESAFVRVPCVFGWLRPVVLVPINTITGMSNEHLTAILLHELAHIRRFDGLVNWLQSVVETVFFFHPAVWIVSAQLRNEREYCADEIAAEMLGDRVCYARALASVAELSNSRASLSESRATRRRLMASTGGLLKRRIESLFHVEQPMKRHRNGWGWLLILLVAVSAIGLESVLSYSTSLAQSKRVDSSPGKASSDATDATDLSVAQIVKRKQSPVEDQRASIAGVKSVAGQAVSGEVFAQVDTRKQPKNKADKAAKKEKKKGALNSLSPEDRKLHQKITKDAVGFLKGQKQDAFTKGMAKSFTNGTLALTGLALLHAGVKSDDEVIDRLSAQLADNKSKMVYSASLELLFRVKRNNPRDKAVIKSLTQELIDCRSTTGGWSYQVGVKSNRTDHSNMNFALWALTSAHRSGVKIDKKVFTIAVDKLLDAQGPNGGWTYTQQATSPTGSMTAGCLGSLLASSDVAEDYRAKEVKQAADKAIKWLSQRFTVLNNPNSNAWPNYYLMFFRRAANEANVLKFGQHDLLSKGIKMYAERQGENGAWKSRIGATGELIPTSMALMFLTNESAGKNID